MSVVRYNFSKIQLMNKIRKKFRSVDFGPINDPINFRHNKQDFSLKIQNCHFYRILYVYHHVQFLKNLMYRFREKINSFKRGSKMAHFPRFGQNENLSQNPNFKSVKKGLQTHGQTDGQNDG